MTNDSWHHCLCETSCYLPSLSSLSFGFKYRLLNKRMAFALLCFREEVSIHALLLLLIWDWLILMEFKSGHERQANESDLRSRMNSFYRCCCKTGSDRWIFFRLGEREWVARPWHGLKEGGGRLGMEFGCTKSSPRVLRVGSIMNHPVEISYINTNSFFDCHWIVETVSRLK